MTPEVERALQEQVQAEMYSAYLYLAMSAWAGHENWPGLRNWLFVQYQEETLHALTLHDQIIGRGARSVLMAIDAPPADFGSHIDIFRAVLKHERYITGRIGAIATLALKENDHALYQFIMIYVKEQVEEEASATDLLRRVERIGDNPGLLEALDKELAARVFTPSFGAAAQA